MAKRDQRAARGRDGAESRRVRKQPAFMESDEDNSEDEARLLLGGATRRLYDGRPDGDEGDYEAVSKSTIYFLISKKRLINLILGYAY